MYDKIKLLSIKDVADKLGLQYKAVGTHEYALLEGGSMTDGRRFNTEKNMAKDFTGKGRPEAGPFDFAMHVLNLDKQQTLDWFANKFGIEKTTTTTQKKDVLDVWASLDDLNEREVQYIQSRGINYGAVKKIVKNFNGNIGCLIYSDGVAKSIVGRNIKDDGPRFQALTGYGAKGVYSSGLTGSGTLYVVEGMFDFLTLRQYTPNVVGLRNWSDGLDEVVKLSKDYQIVYIPDNDETGKQSLKLLQKQIDFWAVDISMYGVKDINEMCTKESLGEDIIQMIEIMKEYQSNGNINQAFELLETYQERYRTVGMLGREGPYPEIDKRTDGIIPGKVYTIAAYSNTGKSKFAYTYASHFLKQGKKVLLLSLEVDVGMVLMNVICTMENVTRKEVKAGYKGNKSLYKNLKIYDDQYKLEDIEGTIKTTQPDIVILDFIQNVQTPGTSSYEKMAMIAKGIQRIAITTNVVFISLSQLSNNVAKEVSKGDTDFVSLKGAGELYASSDVIFLLRKTAGVTPRLNLTIIKNKYGTVKDDFEFEVDYSRGQFTLVDSNTYEF